MLNQNPLILSLSKGELTKKIMTNTFYVYILKCADDSYYTGITDDIETRLKQHNSGMFDGYTKGRRPVNLIFQQCFSTPDEAFIAEQKIKGWSRRKKEALMKNDWREISRLAHEHKLRMST